MKNPRTIPRMFGYGILCGLAFAWAAPFVALAIAAVFTVAGIPLVPVLLWIGCYPFYKLMKYRERVVLEWKTRSQVLPYDDEEVPWDVE